MTAQVLEQLIGRDHQRRIDRKDSSDRPDAVGRHEKSERDAPALLCFDHGISSRSVEGGEVVVGRRNDLNHGQARAAVEGDPLPVCLYGDEAVLEAGLEEAVEPVDAMAVEDDEGLQWTVSAPSPASRVQPLRRASRATSGPRSLMRVAHWLSVRRV